MLDATEATIEKLVIHRVGNKVRDEGHITSKELIQINNENHQVLLNFFLKPFLGIDEVYMFSNPNDISLNDVYIFSKKIFNNKSSFIEESMKIGAHLYEQSTHPKVVEGDLFVVQFSNLKFGNESVDTLGIFKAEKKDIFLKTIYKKNLSSLDTQVGINTKQIDKGCLIFNTQENDGFKVLSVDTNGYDTQYWTDKFLNIVNAQTANFRTKTYLKLCKDFSTEFIENNFDKTEKMIFLSKSVNYFNNNEVFDYKEFSEKVIGDDNTKKEFNIFKKSFELENSFGDLNEFEISKTALKSIKRQFKNFIRLDTNVELKMNFKDIEKSSQFVEKGFDEKKGMHFYKIFYNREIN